MAVPGRRVRTCRSAPSTRTPIVVGGYVYFGTATDPAFYKLTPDGKVRWVYRNPAYKRGQALARAAQRRPQGGERFQSSENGILASALVEGDTVYFGDVGGWFYALDRATGAERWRINARGKDFPGSHPINVFMASPIMADGKIIVAGGTLEQLVAATPFYRGSTRAWFRAGTRAEDRAHHLEVRPGRKAGAARSADHDHG